MACIPIIIQKGWDMKGVSICKAMENMGTEAAMDDRKDTACRLLKKGECLWKKQPRYPN